jgi:plastocyanin
VRSGSDRLAVRVALLGLAAAAALLGLPAGATAHPAHLVEPIVVSDFGYAPADVTIREGRTVQWRWENSIAHSVTTTGSSPEAFDSGMQTEGDPSFVRRFDVPGVYTYESRSGSTPITGIVRVQALPGEAPEISGLRVNTDKAKPQIHFKLNKKADTVVRVEEKRGGEWRTELALSRRLDAGKNRVKVKQRLNAGGYRVEVTAYDREGRVDEAREKFRVRKRP